MNIEENNASAGGFVAPGANHQFQYNTAGLLTADKWLDTQTIVLSSVASEADIYELLAEPLDIQNGQLHLLVCGCKARVVNDPQFHKMLEVVRSQPVIQVRQIDFSKRYQAIRICKNKKTLSRDARTASVSVQASSVRIARPNQNDSKVSELKINLVLVEETCAPEGEIPIRWYLLTTLPIDTVEAVSMFCPF